MPVCTKSRFDRAGFAAEIEMPVPGQPLGPLTYSTLGMWASLISCPHKCRDYEHPASAKLRAMLRSSWAWIRVVRTMKQHRWTSFEKWGTGLTITAVVVAILIPIFLPEIRIALRLDKPVALPPAVSTSEPVNPAVQSPPPAAEPKPVPIPKFPKSRVTPVVHTKPAVPVSVAPASIERVDWRDKQNWRQYLHVGMTRTEVRQLFGDPEKMAVFSTTEMWDYGRGRITFVVENRSDGSLYSWFEPGP